MGTDRLVNAVGAHERFGGPLIVIDFGTATTFDIVDGDGSYVGGVIAPGSIFPSMRSTRPPRNCRASPSAVRPA